MPLVTIICPAFMHEKFIGQALESFVKQRTKFKFQVLACDDKSTDKTSEIIDEYGAKYPDIIKPIYKEEKGGNWQNLLSLINTKYAVINDGDDYFTNPYKLQKQVNFLEENPDFSICFHTVKVIDEDKPDYLHHYPDPESRFNKTVLDINDLLRKNFIQTNSCMYRWRYNDGKNILDDIPRGKGKGISPYDHWIHLLHAEVGKIGFMPDIMSVYRLHSGGIWAGAGYSDEWFMRHGLAHVRFWENAKKRFGYGNDAAVDHFLVQIFEVAKQTQNHDILEKVVIKIKERAAELAEEKK